MSSRMCLEMRIIWPKYNKIVIGISYGNYLNSNGGTDKVILEHQTIFNNKNCSYVYFFPFYKIYFGVQFLAYTMIIDGKIAAEYLSEDELYDQLKTFSEKGYTFHGAFIHHLMGFCLDSLQRILNSVQAPVYVYLHDYYTVCKQINLLRNNKEYCNPLAAKHTCSGCQFADVSRKKRESYQSFFTGLENLSQFIAPSDKCAEIWSVFYPQYIKKLKVIPHQIIYADKVARHDGGDTLKIAFIGRQAFCKGWDIWKKVARLVQEMQLPYRLYYYGTGDEKLENVCNKRVLFSAQNPNAMIEALKKDQIDIVMLLSNWPETYSYTMYEALAANCFILSNENSGNIEQNVRKEHWGIICRDYEMLREMLLNHSLLLEQVRQFQTQYSQYCEVQPNQAAILSLVQLENGGKIKEKDRGSHQLSTFALRNLKKIQKIQRNFKK